MILSIETIFSVSLVIHSLSAFVRCHHADEDSALTAQRNRFSSGLGMEVHSIKRQNELLLQQNGIQEHYSTWRMRSLDIVEMLTKL